MGRFWAWSAVSCDGEKRHVTVSRDASRHTAIFSYFSKIAKNERKIEQKIEKIIKKQAKICVSNACFGLFFGVFFGVFGGGKF